MDLLVQIEDIIEKNGSDFELSKLFKAYIHEYKTSMPELFKENQGKDFLVKHTKELDNIISLMYKTVLRRVFGNYMPMRSSIPIAVIALGSYGREQLCIHSDIDLLIVYYDVEGYNSKLIIEKLFYLALDAGLKLGHRVHEISDLFKAAKEDITIKTSLLESRLVIGSPFTWHAAQKELNRIRLNEPKEFILAKIDEAKIRRKKYPISMQPNIKESVGGLRDAQLITWVAHTIYGIKNIRDLSEILFSDEEYKEYRIALELLFRVRSALHLIAGKQEDRLLLEYIPQVGNLLGFKDDVKLSSKVLEAQWRINNFTQIFVKKMIRIYLLDMKNVALFKKHRIAKGIYDYDSRLYASYKLTIKPINYLLKILVCLPDKEYHYDAGLLNQFTYVKIPKILDKTTYSLLIQLLKREHLYSFLRLFYESGILHKLFSGFRKVHHLPQFDGYHTFPVDLHSIKCIEALENIQEPFIKALYDELDAEDRLILKIVVLLHDAGKGRRQDHSEVGSRLVVPFLKNIHLSEESSSRVVRLIKHHVLMSGVAFRENIHNEKTLYQFMSNVGDLRNLKLLYIHTYADVNGVGPNTFNAFNSKLLHDLYLGSLEVAQNSNRITDAKKRQIIEKRVQNNPEFQTLPKTLQSKILRVESNLFFFKHTPQDIINIAVQAQQTKEYSFKIESSEPLSIEIYRKIPLNISYLLASLGHLDVGSMEIYTLFDEVKYFKIEFIENIDSDELIELEQIIKNSFDMSRHVEIKHIKLSKREIEIDCNHSITHAELKINTTNQKKLLAYIMDAFEQLNINIVSAKIHSTKHKVRDTFLMGKKNGVCDDESKIYKLLTN